MVSASDGDKTARRPKRKRLFTKTYRGLVDVEVRHEHGCTKIIVSDIDGTPVKADTDSNSRS